MLLLELSVDDPSKFPRWLVLLIVLLFAINFTLTIAHHVWRFMTLYRMHRIIVECWFESKSKAQLYSQLRSDQVCRRYLENRSPSASELWTQLDFKHPVILGNLIPALGTLLLFVFT
jgi:hypothetical protein